MTLTIEVELLLGRFEASDGHDGTPPEWPPAPGRLFAALVAGCEAEHADALRWLEEQGAPVIHAGPALTAPPHGRWLVTNPAKVREDDGGSARHPGRKNVRRARQRCWPADPLVRYVWPDANPSDGVVAALDGAARRVGYLGRPTSPAMVRVVTRATDLDTHHERYTTAPTPSFDIRRLRTVYPSFFDALCTAFAANTRVDPPVYDDYRPEAVPPPLENGVCAPAWRHFLTFRLVSDVYVPGERSVQVADAFRAAVLDRIDTEVPAVVAGHGVPAPHCAFLSLPHVGHPHADGHLLGIGLAVPDAEPRVIAALRDALVLDGVEDLGMELWNVPGFRRHRLRFERVTRSTSVAWGLRPERWCRGSNAWRTVLPAVLDRAPSRRLSEEDAVLETVANAGLPEPKALAVSRAPFVAGDIALRPSQTKRRPDERTRPFRHLVLEFHQRVAGPVIVGAQRHFGLGLCAPTPLVESPSEGSVDRHG